MPPRPSLAGLRAATSTHGSVRGRAGGTAALLALVCLLCGIGLATSSPNYAAGSTVLVEALTGPGLGGPGSVYTYSETQRYVLDRMDTWAATARSDRVADAAAVELGLAGSDGLRGRVEATVRPTTQLIDIVVDGGATPDEALARAGAVARATAAALPDVDQRPPGAPATLAASVVDVDDVAVDARQRNVALLVTAAGVVVVLVGWLWAALRAPGRWIETMPPRLGPRALSARAAEADRSIQLEVLGVLLAGQSGKGLAVIAVAGLGIGGYAATGSAVPPLIAVLIAGVAALRDLRYAAFAIILAGISALPLNLSLFPIGPVTPTVLEVAILIGLLATIVRWRPDRPRGPFTGAVLAVLGVLVLGALIGFGRGAELAPLADQLRSGLTLVAFFVLREAFRSRPYQLLAVLLVSAAAASLTVLAALPLGIEPLLVLSRTEVITGESVTDIARLLSPVIVLWSPLLVIIAAGLRRLRAQWLLVVPAVAHLALSFNRSTWVPLVVVVVVVAALRGGKRAVAVRGVQVVAIGTVLLAVAASGIAGAAPRAVADRFLSTINGDFTLETSLSDRIHENGLALATLREDPVLGAGVGRPFGPVDIQYDELQDRQWAEPAFVLHNQYLLIWVLMGVPGLLAYGALAVRLGAYSWHLWRRLGQAAVVPVAASIGVLTLAVQSTFQTNLLNPAALITIAAMLALIETTGTRVDPRPPDATNGPWALVARGPGARKE